MVSANIASSADAAQRADLAFSGAGHGGNHGTRAGASEVVQALENLPRVLRLYPSSHSRIRSHVERLSALLGQATGAGGALELRVDGKELRSGDSVVEGQAAEAFAMRLRLRGLAQISFLPGVSASEIVSAARVLLEEPKELTQHHGGAADRIRELGPHVEAEAARETLSEDGDGDVAGEPECRIRQMTRKELRRLCARLGGSGQARGSAIIETVVFAFVDEQEHLDRRVLERVIREFLESFETVLSAESDDGALSLEECVRSLLAESLDVVLQSRQKHDEAERVSYELVETTALGAKGALAKR